MNTTHGVYIRELFKVFDILLKSVHMKEKILLSDIYFSEDSLEYFKENQNLRSAIVLYMYKKSPAFEIKSSGESLSDFLRKDHSIVIIRRLHFTLSELVSQLIVDEPSQVDIISRCFSIIEEFLWLSLKEEEVNRGIETRINTLESKVKEISSYISKIDELKKLIDSESEESKKVLDEIKDELINQKIDALTMTILVFTAFTFLTVNAGVISGISQIDVINIWQMLMLFIIANFVVLLGISWIMRLLKNVIKNK